MCLPSSTPDVFERKDIVNPVSDSAAYADESRSGPICAHALPLVYDRLTTWEVEKPDIFQRMLLRGIATDSPADAAALHPEMFGNVEHAKKVLSRERFKGQNPMSISYREMSLKSAVYRRSGRGRGWQRAWWTAEDASDVRETLQANLGKLAGWCCAQ